MPDLFSLSGRFILVTGATAGLGELMARGLAAQGGRVFVTSRSTPPPADLVTGQSGDIEHVGHFDLSSRIGNNGLVAAIKSRAPRLDVLIHNAGIYSAQRLTDSDEETWDRVQSTNVRAPFFLTRDLLPLLERDPSTAQRARVICIGSVAGQISSGEAAYAVSKAALHHLTRVLSALLCDRGINVNAIAPGAFRTRMTAAMLDTDAQKVISMTPLKRLGRPADIVGAVVYLASAASEFTTGHVLPVDGGLGASVS